MKTIIDIRDIVCFNKCSYCKVKNLNGAIHGIYV